MKRKAVAITGKIGSGKSAVAGILRDMGYKTVDCDALARQVAANPNVVQRVEQLLGAGSVTNGQLDRKTIRETVFKNENLLRQYEQIFFDGVRALLVQALAALEGEKAVFVEIPVLDAFPFDWNEIWLIESSEQTSVSRVTARDGVTEDSVLSTLRRQKQYASTYVIENNGSLQALTQAVKAALSQSGLI